jgi:dTDP-4-dehydrorhamnose reductase
VCSAPDEVDLSATWRHAPVADGPSTHHIDLRDAEAVATLVGRLEPDVVVHAAYSMHDRADIVDATLHVATACADTGSSLVHLSTDAVFDGEHPPYAEDDVPSPVHEYGRWKLEAEQAAMRVLPDVCITRTSLVVSLDPPDPATRRVLDAAQGDTAMRLFTDELRQPIRVDDLAAELWALVALGRGARAGVWHLPGAEVCSRLELGRRLCRAAGSDPSRLAEGLQSDVPGPRPRDLTMRAGRRAVLGHPPRPI